MTLQWKKLNVRTLLDTRLYTVREEVHSHPSLKESVPFWIIDSCDWVNVIAVDTDSVRDPKARLLWVRQYRVGSESVTWEMPGGCCDPEDPSPLHSAQRELLEEGGATARRWVALGSVSPNPALFRNRVHAFVALGTTIDPTRKLGDGREVIEPEWLPLAERHKLVLDGRADHALVLAAFAKLEAHLQTDTPLSRQL